jgi:hypothetical protein
MIRIPSFTEYALLNRYALDILAPTDFQKLPLSYNGDSAIEAIETAKVNLYSNLRNTSYWHAADRFYLLTPLKFIYNACVILTISRLGMIYNGAMTLCHYLRYRCSLVNSEIEKTSWEKTKAYAYAFFVDTACATLGALIIKGVVQCAVCTLNDLRIISVLGKGSITFSFDSIVFHIMLAAGAILGAWALTLLQSPSVAPDFFVLPDYRVGMYLSLFFRKRLGLVNEAGGLIPFSQRDRLDCDASSRFSGKNYETLTRQAEEAEIQLIEAVRKCNQLLPQGKKIEFKYPFNGHAIAKALEGQVPHNKSSSSSQSLGNLDPLLLKVNQMRSLQAKIRNTREAWETAQKLTFSDSYLMMLLKFHAKISVRLLNLANRPSLLSPEEYLEYFTFVAFPQHTGASTKARPKAHENRTRNKSPFFDYWYNIRLEAIDPSKKKRPTIIFEAFQYDLAVNKWKAHNNQSDFTTYRELLGMDKYTPFLDFKQIKKKYVRALHPDRNKGNPLALELAKCLNEILEYIESEYESKISKAPVNRTNENNQFFDYWSNIRLEAIDPNKETRPTTLFEAFQYDLCVNKWKARHHQSDFKTHREFFGMDSNTPLSSFEQIKKDYLMALDPENNKRNPLATELFKYLNEILKHIESEYENNSRRESEAQ